MKWCQQQLRSCNHIIMVKVTIWLRLPPSTMNIKSLPRSAVKTFNSSKIRRWMNLGHPRSSLIMGKRPLDTFSSAVTSAYSARTLRNRVMLTCGPPRINITLTLPDRFRYWITTSPFRDFSIQAHKGSLARWWKKMPIHWLLRRISARQRAQIQPASQLFNNHCNNNNNRLIIPASSKPGSKSKIPSVNL